MAVGIQRLFSCKEAVIPTVAYLLLINSSDLHYSYVQILIESSEMKSNFIYLLRYYHYEHYY